MKIGDFVDRVRAVRLSKKTSYDDIFERVRRELKFERVVGPVSVRANVQKKTKLGRIVLRLP